MQLPEDLDEPYKPMWDYLVNQPNVDEQKMKQIIQNDLHELYQKFQAQQNQAQEQIQMEKQNNGNE